MKTETLSIFPRTFQQAAQRLAAQNPADRESTYANAVDSLAITEFEATDSAVRRWDEVQGLDLDGRDGFVEVQVRGNEYRGARMGGRWEGESSSLVSTENGTSAMHVEFSEQSVDLYRMKQDPDTGSVSGCHMHHDRVTGEAYLVRV